MLSKCHSGQIYFPYRRDAFMMQVDAPMMQNGCCRSSGTTQGLRFPNHGATHSWSLQEHINVIQSILNLP